MTDPSRRRSAGGGRRRAVAGGRAVCYRARGALLGERWSGEPLSATVRAFLVVAGGVLFSVGALLGYDRVVPVVVDLPAVPGSRWSVIRLSRVALATATHVTE